MLNKLLKLSKETPGVKVLLFYSESEPLYVWSKEEVEPGLVQRVSASIRELVSVVKDVDELIWEGEKGVYVLKPADGGHLLAVLSGWKEMGFYRSVLSKHFNKS